MNKPTTVVNKLSCFNNSCCSFSIFSISIKFLFCSSFKLLNFPLFFNSSNSLSVSALLLRTGAVVVVVGLRVVVEGGGGGVVVVVGEGGGGVVVDVVVVEVLEVVVDILENVGAKTAVGCA